MIHSSDTSEALKAELRAWILERNAKVDPERLTFSTPLVKERVITSLQIMDLILFLESRCKISIEQLQPGAFESIDTIYEHFFGGANV